MCECEHVHAVARVGVSMKFIFSFCPSAGSRDEMQVSRFVQQAVSLQAFALVVFCLQTVSTV